MESNYYYQTRNGKRIRVKKGMSKKLKRDITAGTKSAATSAGFVLGTGLGVTAARAINKNPILKTVSMSAGAIGGSVVATILAERTLYRKNIIND